MRLGRSVQYEGVYVRDYLDGLQLERGLDRWFEDYNHLRPHQALDYETPGHVYRDARAIGSRVMRG